MKLYTIKEVFYSLQGEGARAGRPAVFCRFAGCNLACGFCDTDYTGGTAMSALDVASTLMALWPDSAVAPYIVFTGGEPLLQLDSGLTAMLKAKGCEIAVETNGTQPLPDGVDWVCVSPKAGSRLALRSGSELKLVYPQDGLEPSELEELDFEYFYLQPMDGPDRLHNTELATEYCLTHPKWRLGVQLHKILGVR